MSTESGTEPRKGTFVREFFANNHDANEESVNAAWAAEGREGSISVSLISKIKAELGLTTRGRGPGRPKGSTSAKSKLRGRPRKNARVGGGISHLGNGEHVPSRGPAANSRGGDVLDELEEDLDDLIQKIKDVGEMPDVVKALRRARRLLVRSHEG